MGFGDPAIADGVLASEVILASRITSHQKTRESPSLKSQLKTER
jgi:hypothetical protein